jgi:RNA polymerase sigma-70 factor (ECF subfamily)
LNPGEHTPPAEGALEGAGTPGFTPGDDRYQRRTLRLCQRMLGLEDGRDLFQDVFLQVYRSLGELREPEAFRTWLLRITIRLARRRLEARRRRPRVELQDVIAPAGADPACRQEDLGMLREALHELPERQREVMLLRHFEGLSYADLGRVLGIREDAARANHYQALRRLRQKLHPEDEP